MTRPPLLLASTSPARRALMDALGVPYRAVAPRVDEETEGGLWVAEVVRQLARRKAEAVRHRFPHAFVIGSDQLVSRDDEPLRKPKDRPAAREQLRSLLGREHEIVTAVCLLGPGTDQEHVDVARLCLYDLSNAELEAYLDTREWEGCAGGYRVEAQGQGLVRALEGDRTAVQGLPMVALVRMMREAGLPFFSRAAPRRAPTRRSARAPRRRPKS